MFQKNLLSPFYSTLKTGVEDSFGNISINLLGSIVNCNFHYSIIIVFRDNVSVLN
jgi:hypothetical protein